MNKLICAIYTTLLFVAIYLLFAFGYPQLLAYHEQMQLFLFTSDYFAHSMEVPGGLADYVSEFLVQFYYVPKLGALMTAIVLSLLQCALGAYCYRLCANKAYGVLLYLLSAIPVVILVHAMGDENLLLSLPVALVISTLGGLISQKSKVKSQKFGVESQKSKVKSQKWYMGMILVGFVVMYWLAGPAAIIFALLSVLQRPDLKGKWLWAAGMLAVCLLIITIIGASVLAQYPEGQLFSGINYYRATNVHPASIYAAAIAIIAIASLAQWQMPLSDKALRITALCVFVGIASVGTLYSLGGYDKDKMDAIDYDYLVRQGRWYDIVHKAMITPPKIDFELQAVNLALAMTGQLGSRMFEFGQNGIGSLLSKYQLDNTSCLITAEAFYQLGMINSAFRYAFDLQEAIMNDRKSGRQMKRLAECMIINGNYAVAGKYIDMLKHSMYYKKWAEEAEKYLGNEEMVNAHPEWGYKRRVRFKNELLYEYPQIEKILGLLAIESEGANRLAWDYFIAALLLKGDLRTMTGMYHYADEYFREQAMPKHAQEAMAMFWTMGHQNFDGLPYQISDDVKQKIGALAQAYAQNQNNPGAWQKPFAGTYWVYFLKKQQGAAEAQYEQAEREG